MSRYAEGTEVSAERSQAEIQTILRRYRATGYGVMHDEERGFAAIGFRIDGRAVRFSLPLPTWTDAEFERDGRKHIRTESERRRACDQAHRQRWRALALCIKAKMETVASGIVSFEQEWMPHLVLPNGKTLGEQILPDYQKALEGGKIPHLQLGM